MTDMVQVGWEVRKILSSAVDHLTLTKLEQTLREADRPLDKATVSDILGITQVLSRELREELGYEGIQRLTKSIQKIKPRSDLAKLRQQPATSLTRRREVDILVELGKLESVIGDFEGGITSFRHAVRKAKEIVYPERQAEALVGLGHIYKHQTDWEGAIRNFEEAKTIAEKIKNHLVMADATRGLGYVSWRRCEYQTAFGYHAQARTIAEERNFKAMLGGILIDTALVYNETGDLEQARLHMLEAIPFLEEVNEFQEISRAYNNLGDIDLQSKDYAAAIENFDKCQEYASRIHYERMIAWAAFNAGEAYNMQGDGQACLASCERALPILLRLDDSVGLNALYRNLAVAYSLLDDWIRCDENIVLAQEVLTSISSPFNDAHLMLEIGEIEIRRGDRAKAREMLEKAGVIFAEIGSKNFAERVEAALKGL